MITSKVKTCLLLVVALTAMQACSNLKPAQRNAFQQHPEEKLGWKIGVQASTFRRFTFFETIDKVKSCGLKYVEAFTGQDIGGGIEGKTDYRMDIATREKILQKLKEKDVELIAYGVVTPNTQADWRQLFEFGKAMGIKTFTSEPAAEDIPLISKLCDKYKINVAIHNHAEPTRYWDPDKVLAVIKGKNKRIGVCADIGHWMRSGLDPVECLKKLDGYILASHMKDLNEIGNKKAHDVQWGKGKANIYAVVQELKRQKFKGVISVEYEYNRDETWYNSVPDIKASLNYFRKVLK